MNRHLRIDGWYGRLGNNIQQIGNALMLCELVGYKGVIIPAHSCLDFSYIPLQASPCDLDSSIDVKQSNFFHWKEGTEKTILLPYRYIKDNMVRVLQCYLLPLIKLDCFDIKSFDGLTIHMRGGDVFEAAWFINGLLHIQNPLIYYKDLIRQYQRCRIITEPRWETNPVINSLLKDHPNLIIQSSTVWNDFITLMNSEVIATSGVGTFAIAAALLNKRLQKLHHSDLYLDEHLNPEFLESKFSSVEILKMNLPGYIQIGKWYNTDSKAVYAQLSDQMNDSSIFEKFINADRANGWGDLYFDLTSELVKKYNSKDILEIGVAFGAHAEKLITIDNIASYTGIDPYLSGYDDVMIHSLQILWK